LIKTASYPHSLIFEVAFRILCAGSAGLLLIIGRKMFLSLQLGDSHRHRIERLVTAPTWEFNTGSSVAHEMAVRVNVDRAFNMGDIKSVYAICAWFSSCVAGLWQATFGFGVFEGFNCPMVACMGLRIVGLTTLAPLPCCR
jgi:hypothetical protein